MLKIFDLTDNSIKKSKKLSNLKIFEIELDEGILNLKFSDTIDIIKKNIINCTYTNNDYVYFKLNISGKCTKQDIEDLYGMTETVLVNLFVTDDIKPEQQDRLGIFGLPQINLKTINLMRLVRYKNTVSGFGFEIAKKNNLWAKRMVK